MRRTVDPAKDEQRLCEWQAGTGCCCSRALPHFQLRVLQVLVFSHSVRMLRIIQKMMMAKGYAYVVLDGSTPQVSLQHMRLPAPASCAALKFLIAVLQFPHSSTRPLLAYVRQIASCRRCSAWERGPETASQVMH